MAKKKESIFLQLCGWAAATGHILWGMTATAGSSSFVPVDKKPSFFRVPLKSSGKVM